MNFAAGNHVLILIRRPSTQKNYSNKDFLKHTLRAEYCIIARGVISVFYGIYSRVPNNRVVRIKRE